MGSLFMREAINLLLAIIFYLVITFIALLNLTKE